MSEKTEEEHGDRSIKKKSDRLLFFLMQCRKCKEKREERKLTGAGISHDEGGENPSRDGFCSGVLGTAAVDDGRYVGSRCFFFFFGECRGLVFGVEGFLSCESYPTVTNIAYLSNVGLPRHLQQ